MATNLDPSVARATLRRGLHGSDHALAARGVRRSNASARAGRPCGVLLLLALALGAVRARAECASTAECEPGLECRDGGCVAPTPALPVDTVFLVDGGRVRGQVMEEHPKSGVRIRLADGTVREIPANEVDHVEYGAPPGPPTPSPAPPPPTPPAPSPPESPTAAQKPVATTDRAPKPARPASSSKPKPPSPRLRVVAGEPGTLRVDGKAVGPVGSAPRDVRDLSAGPHDLEVAFDGGETSVEHVVLEGGEPLDVAIEPPGARHSFRHREGLRFGFGAGGFYLFRPLRYAEPRPVETVLGMSEHGGGGYVEGIANLGLTPTVDLRVVPRVAFGSVPLERRFTGTVSEAPDWIAYVEDSSPQTNAFAVVPSALVAVRLNLTSRYSIMLGFRAGLEAYVAGEDAESGKDEGGLLQYEGSTRPASSVRAHVGPELSPLSLQLGARRELEIECWQGLLIDSMPSLQMGLGVRYLVLP